jgi:nucleolar complex protein 3
MKHVFATYFRVLRKMPDTTLVSPVLAGLSKFAHLINIDFFDDLINSFEGLIENKVITSLCFISKFHNFSVSKLPIH